MTTASEYKDDDYDDDNVTQVGLITVIIDHLDSCGVSNVSQDQMDAVVKSADFIMRKLREDL